MTTTRAPRVRKPRRTPAEMFLDTIKDVVLAAGRSDEDLLSPAAEHFHLRVENGGYMPLVIEAFTVHLERPILGAVAHRVLSVAHYFESNGDLVADPEVELLAGRLLPLAITQGFFGRRVVGQLDEDRGQFLVSPSGQREVKNFAGMWARNIREQGFAEAARQAVLLRQHGYVEGGAPTPE